MALGWLAWSVLSWGACGDLADPEPELPVSACRYLEACSPGFSLAFPTGIDRCIAALQDQPTLFDPCGAGPDTRERCLEQLDDSLAGCVDIDRGACASLLSCGSVQCAANVSAIDERCPEIEFDAQAVVALCPIPGGGCLVRCLAEQDCKSLGSDGLLSATLGICINECELFSE